MTANWTIAVRKNFRDNSMQIFKVLFWVENLRFHVETPLSSFWKLQFSHTVEINLQTYPVETNYWADLATKKNPNFHLEKIDILFEVFT